MFLLLQQHLLRINNLHSDLKPDVKKVLLLVVTTRDWLGVTHISDNLQKSLLDITHICSKSPALKSLCRNTKPVFYLASLLTHSFRVII